MSDASENDKSSPRSKLRTSITVTRLLQFGQNVKCAISKTISATSNVEGGSGLPELASGQINEEVKDISAGWQVLQLCSFLKSIFKNGCY